MLQHYADQVSAAYANNVVVGGTLSDLMSVAAAACVPLPAGADPVSRRVATAFKAQKNECHRAVTKGMVRFNDGNAKLPESSLNYLNGDAAGGMQVTSRDVFGN
ncbi:PE domain-containing protein [Nocardia wallacei]|uniref:PE domain-containing protein n=1 Tax=Nocardia wallacei TaxID=480035 RepID=UPI00245601E4|nr:PE domain-containing protein [Nocardia wallacei]